MSAFISVIDDEPDILDLVSLHLKKTGFIVNAFLNGKSFFNSLESKRPDLIILDLMLPDMDGFDICRRLKEERAYKDIPIIMLTARAEETDKVLGLELGADDYIVKPFSPRELIARVRTILRRKNYTETLNDEKIVIGKVLELDLKKYSTKLEGKDIELTPTEFNILKILATRKGWVYSREQILDALWGEEKAVLDRTIDVHIKNIRKKLGPYGSLIKNVRGVGYKLEDE